MNEFQMAYENSNILFEGDRIERIPDGMFAVVSLALAYCQVTDAVLHKHHRRIVKLWGTRRLAEHHASELTKKLDPDGESWYEVLPKDPKPKPRPFHFDQDDIPF